MAYQILIVDDHPGTAHITSVLCRGEGYAPTVATNADEALELLRREQFDIALVDVAMPGMDGLTLTRLIRATPQWEGLPVIGMTAVATPTIRQDAVAAGMDKLIFKPFEIGTLRMSLLRLLP
ncbi:MAG TPA: response regulator [Oscillatoriaceae cyanobacterium]